MAPDFQVNEFKIFVWTLVDSDQAKDGVPPQLVENRTRLFVLYASSPNRDRWKRLHKNVERHRNHEPMDLERDSSSVRLLHLTIFILLTISIEVCRFSYPPHR